MLLSQLYRAVPGAQLTGSGDVEIRDIAYDSRRVRPGTLFVAVPSVGGDWRTGGYQHISEAVARGASAIAGEHIPDAPVSVLQVLHARQALGDLANAFFGYPSQQMALFAVTGTDGKTTTAFFLEHILRQSGRTTGLLGTVQTVMGDRVLPNVDRMTTPESLDLQRLLRDMIEAGVSHVAMEASSHALALHRLHGCHFAACALTNITADHLEFHGDWERYYRAKESLFTGLSAGNTSVLNRDDTSFSRLSKAIQGPVMSYGLEGHGDLQAKVMRSTVDGSDLELVFGSERAATRIGLPGRFNVYNALAATGLGLCAGVSLHTIAVALANAKSPPGRFYRVQCGQPFEIIVDYAHTTNAFRSLLATVRALTPAPGRVIAVFGAAGNRDRDKRPEMARLAEEISDFFFITNEDPFGESPEDIVADIAAGTSQAQRFRCELDRGRAIADAIAMAQPGDSVVITGKGHEQSIVVESVKQPWSDVAAVRQALGVPA